MSAAPDVDLRLRAQRALLRNVPATLRAVSAEIDGACLRFRAVFDSSASDSDKELLRVAATELVADFGGNVTLDEEILVVPAPSDLAHLRHVLFVRYECFRSHPMNTVPGPFQTQVVSDVVRDGLGIELVSAGGMAVAEVFRCDADHTLSVTFFAEAIPLAALETLIERAKVELDPFQDGTPLLSARSHVV